MLGAKKDLAVGIEVQKAKFHLSTIFGVHVLASYTLLYACHKHAQKTALSDFCVQWRVAIVAIVELTL